MEQRDLSRCNHWAYQTSYDTKHTTLRFAQFLQKIKYIILYEI